MKIQNLKIEKGVSNWEKDGMTCGSVDVILPNGTKITIRASKHDDWNDCEVLIHRLRDTELTIFNKNSKLVKKQTKHEGTAWTVITTKEE